MNSFMELLFSAGKDGQNINIKVVLPHVTRLIKASLLRAH